MVPGHEKASPTWHKFTGLGLPSVQEGTMCQEKQMLEEEKLNWVSESPLSLDLVILESNFVCRV